MDQDKQKLSLHQPVCYEITVPGVLDERWLESGGGIKLSIERTGEDSPITILTGEFDQAALHSLLRLLYSLGLPLISVICVGGAGDKH